MSKKGYGGFFGPLFNAIGNAIARELLVQSGRKQAHRGGARITQARRMVEGKDKNQRELHPLKSGSFRLHRRR